ncbi:MAG: flavin reductase family protein [Gemmatimonadaceae bacterium]|nr:flavin reductase family protein [Gemmatimonadaceae bacterium]
MTPSESQQFLSPDRFRELMSRFASGVTILTTLDDRDRPHGMTVSAFSSLSLVPPLVLVCVDRSATMLDVLDRATYFAVSVLSESQVALSRRFSLEEMELRFEGVAHSSGISGVPRIDGALMVVECRRRERFDAGDHAIFVGEVIGGSHDPEGRPLVHWSGTYGRMER